MKRASYAVLPAGYDGMPIWSPDGNRILFNRGELGSIWSNFDVYTVWPDGSDLQRLTDHPASDGHAVWTPDGKQILYNTGMAGYRDEACHYDNTFQPYGQLMVMNADGSGKPDHRQHLGRLDTAICSALSALSAISEVWQ